MKVLFPPFLLAALLLHTFGIDGTGSVLDSESELRQGDGKRVAVLVPIAAHASWLDDAFLCAVPAAAVLGNGEPIVLAVDAAAPWRAELVDFLDRFSPTRLLWVGPQPPPVPSPAWVTLECLPADNQVEAAVALSSLAWPTAKRVVLFDAEDRSVALAAAAFAARLGVPLFPWTDEQTNEPVLEAIGALKAKTALFVGKRRPPQFEGVRVEGIKNAEGVVRWLVRHGFDVDYLAAVNPNETVAGRDRHLALAAPILAAGRAGVVAPLPYETQWKTRFAAEEVAKKAPRGAAESTSGWRQGSIQLGDKSIAFVTGQDPTDGRWWLQLDRDGDGDFRGNGEGTLFTGDDFDLGGMNWTADLDANEHARGQAAWLTSPTASEICADLGRLRKAAKNRARYLCLIGWPEALPMAVIDHGQGIDADLVSDLPFGQTDEDPFVELAVARFVAEDLPSATLLACRGLARDDLPERAWASTFATAEWAGACRGPMEDAGFQHLGHHPGGGPFDASSPLAEAELIVHGSHAMWTVLGETYAWDSTTLLAPALVDSSGCSTASLDQDAEHRSVAARLLRNGAVAFAGNTRRAVAQQNLFQSELWNALLSGATLGEAQRAALNRVTVTMLEKGQTSGGLYYYQLYNHAVYGDPALQLGFAHEDARPQARVEQRGLRVEVHAPEVWHRFEYAPSEEWGCSFPQLYTWRGTGMGVESTWYDPEKRNQDDLFLIVEARTRHRVDTVEPIGDVPAGLGWTGKCFIDEHADGSRSLYWRVRLIDGDMTSGEVRARADHLGFRLVKE